MELAVVAWDKVDATAIVNCWGHTGILPGPKRAVTSPVTEMEALRQAMHQLEVAARDGSIDLDLSAAEEFMDNGETDEYVLIGYMSIDEICDFVRYVDDDDADKS